jgi:diphosphomevalonate decarboxylase
VPSRITTAIGFIAQKDFSGLSEIIMRESNELHANCAATFPPIRYLQDRSHTVIEAIHKLNSISGRAIAAYSFDAGPNPFIFALQQDIPTIKSHLLAACGIEETTLHLAKPADGIKCQRL